MRALFLASAALVLLLAAPESRAGPTCQDHSGETIRCGTPGAMPVGWTGGGPGRRDRRPLRSSGPAAQFRRLPPRRLGPAGGGRRGMRTGRAACRRGGAAAPGAPSVTALRAAPPPPLTRRRKNVAPLLPRVSGGGAALARRADRKSDGGGLGLGRLGVASPQYTASRRVITRTAAPAATVRKGSRPECFATPVSSARCMSSVIERGKTPLSVT